MKKLSIAICILAILLIIGGGALTVCNYIFGDLEKDDGFTEALSNIEDSETKEVREKSGLAKLEDSNIKNIVLFGIDSEQGEAGRSDSTMILSVDNVHNKIKLTSIARDSLVYIPEQDVTEKLTHAYSYGGAPLAVATLNKNFNLGVSDYISVNFSEMESIIDAVGGVDVDLSEAELGDMVNRRGTDCSNIAPGENVHLNGAQAVSYTRIRYIDTDDMRTSRQREVLMSMFDEVKHMSKKKYPSLIKNCMASCTTSLSYSEILSLATIMAKSGVKVEEFAVPSETSTEPFGGVMASSGAWCFVYNTRDASSEILQFIYEELYDEADIDLPEATITKDILTDADWANNVY